MRKTIAKPSNVAGIVLQVFI